MAKNMDPTLEELRREQAKMRADQVQKEQKLLTALEELGHEQALMRAAQAKKEQKPLTAITVALTHKEKERQSQNLRLKMQEMQQEKRRQSAIQPKSEMFGPKDSTQFSIPQIDWENHLNNLGRSPTGANPAQQKVGNIPDQAWKSQFDFVPGVSMMGNGIGQPTRNTIFAKNRLVGSNATKGQAGMQKLAAKESSEQSYGYGSIADPSSIIQIPNTKEEQNFMGENLGGFPIEVWELATMRLSTRDRMRFVNETNHYLASLKKEINAANFHIPEQQKVGVLLNIIENVKNINPQLASILAKDLLRQGIGDIDNLEVEIDYSAILDHQAELSNEEKPRYYKQMREWMLGHVEKTSLSKNYKAQMLQYMSDMTDEQLDRLANILAARGFDQGIGEEDFRHILFKQKGTAQIIDAKTASIDQVSTMRPHITYPPDFNPNTSFSYYYYNNGQYYTDIYYNGGLAGRLPLGEKLPRMVKIFATIGSAILELDDQITMATNLLIQSGIYAGMDAYFKNNTSVSFSDFPYNPDLLGELFPIYVNNVDMNTIVITVNVWRPTYKIGNDMVSKTLLIRPVHG